ncbi:unnamed protein product [Mytilus edulis]|uniref:Uncharacterized protein n=1 Tax=Mytilus edulis TaxID=6550 RepID=A0A8S3UMJ4_MYTED|nr:unnamed protein product [Mytilus edulis]
MENERNGNSPPILTKYQFSSLGSRSRNQMLHLGNLSLPWKARTSHHLPEEAMLTFSSVDVNKDIVTSPYNPNKACLCLVYYTSTTDRGKRSRIDFDEGFDINEPDLLRTPPHTWLVNIEMLAERPDTPYQPQQCSRINKDIVTSPYNPNKACLCLVYYTSTTDRGKRSRIDFDEGFDINEPDLLRTPPHTWLVNIEMLAERPDTPYQPQQCSGVR